MRLLAEAGERLEAAERGALSEEGPLSALEGVCLPELIPSKAPASKELRPFSRLRERSGWCFLLLVVSSLPFEEDEALGSPGATLRWLCSSVREESKAAPVSVSELP